jgi:hypothetical protein
MANLLAKYIHIFEEDLKLIRNKVEDVDDLMLPDIRQIQGRKSKC